MNTVADVADWLENFAPSRLAESWDNVGLLWGDPATSVERVMTCLTVTPRVAEEAIAERAGLIVSHHPILFRGTKRLRADQPETGFLWRLAQAGIAVASPHTAFDNTEGGINDILCESLGLHDRAPLRPSAERSHSSKESFKIVVFTPESDREAVLSAAFAAGGGEIGEYSECSFFTPGEGTFFGSESTNPAVGSKGHRERVEELRIEIVCPSTRLIALVDAIRRAHSYEEPAIDVYPLWTPPPRTSSFQPGAGRHGVLASPTTLGDFVSKVAVALGTRAIQVVGDPSKMVQRVSIVCGAGDDFLPDAARIGADVLLTGEARFHRGLEAEALGIGLVVAGHHATERIGVEHLAQRIAQAFPKLNVWPSRSESDPFQSLNP